MKIPLVLTVATMAAGSAGAFSTCPNSHSHSHSNSCSHRSNAASTSTTQLKYIVSSPSSYDTHHAHGYYNVHAPPPPGSSGNSNSKNNKNLDQVLDLGISEESILKHYREWCAKFGRRQDKFRFIVFQRNYLSQFKWNLAAGRQAFTLNEFADCTEEEYIQIMKRNNNQIVKHPSTFPVEAVVVEDEEDSARRVERERASEEFHVSLHAIDVEVLDHHMLF